VTVLRPLCDLQTLLDSIEDLSESEDDGDEMLDRYSHWQKPAATPTGVHRAGENSSASAVAAAARDGRGLGPNGVHVDPGVAGNASTHRSQDDDDQVAPLSAGTAPSMSARTSSAASSSRVKQRRAARARGSQLSADSVFVVADYFLKNILILKKKNFKKTSTRQVVAIQQARRPATRCTLCALAAAPA
jgi:hypothetical protein